MTDPAPIKLPASHIDEDTATVMDAAPYKPVNWEAAGTVMDRLDSATKAQLMSLARGGIGDV